MLEQVVDFAQSRHEVLAGNLANLDTPGYRVRDLSQTAFEKQLGEAIRVRDAPAVGRLFRFIGGASAGPPRCDLRRERPC